jgi:hypothetical protein
LTDNWPRLRAAARLAALVGVIGTVGFLLHAVSARHGSCCSLMAGWVLSPYVILAVLDRFVARAGARSGALRYDDVRRGTSLMVSADAVRPLAARSAVPYVLVRPSPGRSSRSW